MTSPPSTKAGSKARIWLVLSVFIVAFVASRALAQHLPASARPWSVYIPWAVGLTAMAACIVRDSPTPLRFFAYYMLSLLAGVSTLAAIALWITEPIPPEHQALVGRWTGYDVGLAVSSWGWGVYERTDSKRISRWITVSTELGCSGPLHVISAQRFAIHCLFKKTQAFDVEGPRLDVEPQWLTLNGAQLVRVKDP